MEVRIVVDINYTLNEIVIVLYPEDLKPDVAKILMVEGIIDENDSVFGVATIYREKNL